MLRKIERKLGRFAIPNLTLFLVAGQVGAFVLAWTKPEFGDALTLFPDRVMEGEAWRLVSFLFFPPDTWKYFVLFSIYVLYLFGSAMQEHWGDFRFNVYMLIGWLATVGAAFLSPHDAATNMFLMESVAFAFAYLNPNLELRLMFILPVKVKWIALFMAGKFLFQFVFGGWGLRALICAGVLNFFLFFGYDIYVRIRGAGRRKIKQREREVARGTASHTCAVCGVNDLEDPKMQFRYCSQCDGGRGYCADHIRDHDHVKAS
jgi:hypothetical protein